MTRRRWRDERGAVMVLVTFALPVLILFASFVIDSGDFFAHKRHLQTQVDAAALAGGDAFQSCFGGSGNQGVFDAATVYNGATSPQSYFPGYTPTTTPLPDNEQIGGTSGSVHLLYNSNTFYDGTSDVSPIPAASVSGGPCASPYVFDVKATESNLPLFFGGFWGLARSVTAINARARVQLNNLQQTSPSAPIAVPDVRPKAVTVTFVDTTSNTQVGFLSLTGPTLTNGLNVWTGSGGVTLAADASGRNVVARIGVGGSAGSCFNVSAGANYVCYDAGSVGTGLLQIRDYAATGGSPSASSPVLRAAWPYTNPSTCGGTTSPFFYITTGNCNAAVQAVVDCGGACTRSVCANLAAASGGGNGTTLQLTALGPAPAPLTGTLYGPSSGTPYPFSIPALAGAYKVTLGTRSSGCGGSLTNFANAPQQQLYSGFDDDATSGSGPIRLAQLSSSAPSPAPYALPGGTTQTVTVSIGLQTNYAVSTPCANGTSGHTYSCATDPPALLRITTSGSHTYVVECGDPVPAGQQRGSLYDELRYGCLDQFSINANDICPDPANPAPPDCAQVGSTGSGNKTGQVRQALNDRFDPTGAACVPNRYPNLSAGDPRVLTLIMTDFSAFDGNGAKTLVPVVTFGAFYVTGWDGADASCLAQNEAPPPNDTKGLAAIWGHFIRYVDTLGSGSTSCTFNGLDPCVPVLTK